MLLVAGPFGCGTDGASRGDRSPPDETGSPGGDELDSHTPATPRERRRGEPDASADDAAVPPELAAAARRLRAGANPWYGLAPMRRLEARLERRDLPAPERFQALMQLSVLETREGRTDDAIAHAEAGLAILERLLPHMPAETRAPMQAETLRALATARLRHAENRACVARHSPQSCILPFREGGIHDDTAPARRALDDWLAVLALRPDDLEARWAANVLAAAIGEHPDALPDDLRVDFAANQDTADGTIRPLRNVAPAVGLADVDLAGGLAVEDFDGDGRLDVVSSTLDPEGSLAFFRNRGDGTFEDATAESGLQGQVGSLNLVAADHDGDGDADLLVLRGAWLMGDGEIRNSLLENDGTGRFEDVTEVAGLASPAAPTQAAAWADFDGDGDLDLYVANEVRLAGDGPVPADPTEMIGARVSPYPAQLFRNDGDGTFTDVAREAGVENLLMAKGVAVGDHDGDGDPDLYVSNFGANRLYRNDGGMRFTDVAREAGVVEPSGRSFATWFFDHDEDGDLDLWVGAYDARTADVVADLLGRPQRAGSPRLYRNRGDGTFEDVAAEAGLDHPYLPMGAGFGDLDGDGWQDVVLGTGAPEYTALVPNVLLLGDGRGGFRDVTFAAGLGHLQKGHGVAFADLDDDGDVDLHQQLGGFFRGDAFANALFLNELPKRRFLHVRLVGTRSNRAGFGARLRVVVETPEGPRTIHRAPGSVSSFGGAPTQRQEIGLGDATRILRLEVDWPHGGERQTFRDVPLDAFVEVVEGEASLRRLPLEPIRMPPG